MDIDDIQREIAALSCRRIARLRRWISVAYDESGLRTRADLDRPAITSSIHTNLRQPHRWSHVAPNLPSGLERAGIYGIASNYAWLYVGFAKNIALRRTNHATNLRNGKHHNRLLQRHWDRENTPLWFVVLQLLEPVFDRGVLRGEHPEEFAWKKRLRPIYDREARRSDVSLLLATSEHSLHVRRGARAARRLVSPSDSTTRSAEGRRT